VGPRAGLDTETRGKILSPLSGIEIRSPGRPARSQTLYCLSYPGSQHIIRNGNFTLLGDLFSYPDKRRCWVYSVSPRESRK
jgi:hypothetical protein